MHNPHAGVISRESNEHVAARGQQSSVTTSRVVEVKTVGGSVPGTCAATDDVVVVAVEMDGVGKGDFRGRLDVPHVPAFLIHGVHVAVWTDGAGASEHGFERRIVPVYDVGRAVD